MEFERQEEQQKASPRAIELAQEFIQNWFAREAAKYGSQV